MYGAADPMPEGYVALRSRKWIYNHFRTDVAAQRGLKKRNMYYS